MATTSVTGKKIIEKEEKEETIRTYEHQKIIIINCRGHINAYIFIFILVPIVSPPTSNFLRFLTAFPLGENIAYLFKLN